MTLTIRKQIIRGDGEMLADVEEMLVAGCVELPSELPTKRALFSSGCPRFARSAVAGDQTSNRKPKGLIAFFANLRNEPRRSIEFDDDNTSPRTIVVKDRGPKKKQPTTTTSVGKWERLGELGITAENFGDQSQEFRDQVGEYLSDHSPNDDWSGFQPRR